MFYCKVENIKCNKLRLSLSTEQRRTRPKRLSDVERDQKREVTRLSVQRMKNKEMSERERTPRSERNRLS